MGKGRYLKAAERACARKARFETAASAEAFVERRYRVYRCVVCGGWHLTSGQGERTEPDPPRKEPQGPTLRDLNWSAVLDPQPERRRGSAPGPSLSSDVSGRISETIGRDDEERGPCSARCVGACGKDGRVLLVIDGRLVKSRTVERSLRGAMDVGVEVRVEGDPPRVIRVV